MSSRLNAVGWSGLAPASDRHPPYLCIVLGWPQICQDHLWDTCRQNTPAMPQSETGLSVQQALHRRKIKRKLCSPSTEIMETVKAGGGTQDNMETTLVSKMPGSGT